MCFNEYSCSKADWIGGQVSLQFEIGMVNGGIQEFMYCMDELAFLKRKLHINLSSNQDRFLA
jgi:hypothetical protein